jgi:hypothetical protein
LCLADESLGGSQVGFSALGVLLLEGGRWVGPRVELGQGRLGSRESVSETGSRAEMAVEVSGRKAAEGGSWTSLMRVSARSTPTGRHSGGAGGGGRQVVEIRYTSIQSH